MTLIHRLGIWGRTRLKGWDWGRSCPGMIPSFGLGGIRSTPHFSSFSLHCLLLRCISTLLESAQSRGNEATSLLHRRRDRRIIPFQPADFSLATTSISRDKESEETRW